MNAAPEPGPAEVLAFWFGPEPLQPRNTLWWQGGDDTDREIRNRFGRLLEQALKGKLDDWETPPQHRLALIVLLDQFARNVHRGTARAFAGDERALALVQDGLAKGLDESLHPLEACFFYMPLEHSESLSHQDRCVACFQGLLQRLEDESLRPVIQSNLDFAHQHRDIIQRFGRFPHRNRVLGRTSTPEETTYLAEGGRSFGQG